MRRHAHAGDGMGVQSCVEVRAAAQQPGMNDQGATLDGPDVGIREHVAIEIDLQQRGRCHLPEHPVRALDQHVIRLARHAQAEMIIGHVVDAIMRQHAVPGCEFDTGAPLQRADLLTNRTSLGDELNGHAASPITLTLLLELAATRSAMSNLRMSATIGR